MSKRNGTVTDAYDRTHRQYFTESARGMGLSRQWARYQWARRVRGATISRPLTALFDAVSRQLANEGVA